MGIRTASSDDVPVLFEMTSRLSSAGNDQLDPVVFAEQFHALLALDSSVAFIAESAHNPVGYAVGLVAPMPVYNGSIALLQELYVEESQRRLGFGRGLVDAFTAWGVRRGATDVVLATSRAGTFYETLGFTTGGALWYRRRT